MKKNIFFTLLGLFLVSFAISSCNKSDSGYGSGGASTGIEGKWTGNYNNPIGGPIYYLSLTFQSGGALSVAANSNSTPDIANGTWYMAADSVRATFTYVSGTAATYSIAGKYSSSSNVIVGTMGIGTNTSGAGVFSVTRE